MQVCIPKAGVRRERMECFRKEFRETIHETFQYILQKIFFTGFPLTP